MAHFTLDQATSMLPLIAAIAGEIVARRTEKYGLARLREELEVAATPEGLSSSLANLDARIFDHDAAIQRSIDEIEGLGLRLLRLDPMTVHFPGHTRNGDVVFCWQEGETDLCHGHALGEEEEPRRPLMVRVVDAPKT